MSSFQPFGSPVLLFCKWHLLVPPPPTLRKKTKNQTKTCNYPKSVLFSPTFDHYITLFCLDWLRVFGFLRAIGSQIGVLVVPARGGTSPPPPPQFRSNDVGDDMGPHSGDVRVRVKVMV